MQLVVVMEHISNYIIIIMIRCIDINIYYVFAKIKSSMM